MKTKHQIIQLVLFGAAIALGGCCAQKNYSPDKLADRSIERRAVEAVIWGMPVVNTDLMRQEMFRKTAGRENEVLYWSRPADANNQTLTPNPDCIYFLPFFNTKDVGPMVLELPPADTGSFAGSIMTFWQMPLADVGPDGADHGKGGKYLILPPGYKDKPPEGYVILQSDTYSGYALLRSNLRSHSEADIEKSQNYGQRVKFYPLSQAANPPATKFSDASPVLFDSTIRYDASFFENLNRVVQAEPWIDRDRVMIDQLKSIGIEKGKPFTPDEKMKAILTKAIAEAHALLEMRYDAGMPEYNAGIHWTLPAMPGVIAAYGNSYGDPDAYPVDDRGLGYTYAFVGIRKLGAAQFYLISIKDKSGKAYEGSKTYVLHVPANAPVKDYWSVTAYDREIHTVIKGMPRASRASNQSEVRKNGDSSVDIYIGPKAPSGKETNWLPTDPKRGFDLMFRFYGPTPELFDKTWKLPDVEEVK
ncbi:MAG TPA: DUF1254 domain-containing protein [Verrucomicrobiae bacterium]|nr:DUF1254 domain-containing protein [Verrucomicrobiae bacterium]